MLGKALNNRLGKGMDRLRLSLARSDALIALSLLGVACGVLSGLLIIALRLTIESGLAPLLGLSDAERFETLQPAYRLALATVGGLLVGVLFRSVPAAAREVGVVHVLERLAYHQARLPPGNAIMQFLGTALCLGAGHSLGREGPAVHLGAASGSLLGRSLDLPNNSNRVLVGAGCAGAIAAAFNTPLAGVVFAMEVILMEYAVRSFTPVIVAAVVATAAARLVFGDEPAFVVPPLQPGHLGELPFVVALGVAAGLMAVAFISAVQRLQLSTRSWGLIAKGTLAGLITGLIAVPLPQVMGVGYDTVNTAMVGNLGAGLLIAVAAAKLLATAVCVGLGLPGGLIAPALVMGAALGGALGVIGAEAVPDYASSPGYYAILGMGAAMAATLQAPLAALTAVLELTYNPALVLPGMLAIVAATVTARALFDKESVFLILLRARGLDYRHNAMETALSGIGAAGIADRSFAVCGRRIAATAARQLLAQRPHWLLIDAGAQPPWVMPAADLANHIEEGRAETDELDLLAIPAGRLQAAEIGFGSSLLEAQQTLAKPSVDVVLVRHWSTPGGGAYFGVLTQGMVTRAYAR